MGLNDVFRDGLRELTRSSLRQERARLSEKEKQLSDELTRLGRKAWDAKIDIRPFGSLSETLAHVEQDVAAAKAKLEDLTKEISRLGERRKAENARCDALLKGLETQKERVDGELKSEGNTSAKASKEIDSVQKRLRSIPDDLAAVQTGTAARQAGSPAAAESEKRLAALKAEQDQLQQRLSELTRVVQMSRERTTPLAGESHHLDGEIRKARDERKKLIDEIDEAVSSANRSLHEWTEKHEVLGQQQDEHYLALGKQLFEAGAGDAALGAGLAAAQAIKQEMASIEARIQSLEGQRTAAGSSAVWKLAGVLLSLLVAVAVVALGVVFLSRHGAGKTGGPGASETQAAQAGKSVSQTAQQEPGDFLVTPAGGNEPLAPERREKLAANLEELEPVLKGVLAEIPRDSFDAQSVVDKVGKDAGALFQWVRDNTYLVPYRGVLRGAAGVLMDRRGNSLDRALLLGALLKLAGHEARLGHAGLSDAAVRDALPQVKPLPRDLTLAREDDRKVSSLLEDALRKWGGDVARFRQDMESLTKAEQDERASALQLIGSQTALVKEALGRGRSGTGGDVDSQIQMVRDHWWVQVKKEDSWVDLDPTLPKAEPGQSLARAEDTYDLENCPESLFHTVKVSAVVEQWKKGSLNEQVVLEFTARTAGLFGQQIMLYQVPLNWPKDSDASPGQDAIGSWKTNVSAQTEWLPMLNVGSKAIRQWSFTDAGDVNRRPGQNGKGLAPPGAAVFGGLGSKEPEEESDKTAVATAEWIEYELAAPGEAPRKIRREVFDLLGPAARSSGRIDRVQISDGQRLERGSSILAVTDILPVVCQPSRPFVNRVTTERLLNSAAALRDALKNNQLTTINHVRQAAWAALESMQGALYGWALLRSEWSPQAENTYVDSVNIANFRTWATVDAQGQARWHRLFDLVNNGVGVRHDTKTSAIDVRIAQGVTDTVAEQLALGRQVVAQGTSALTTLATAQGVKWRVMQKVGDERLSGQALPQDVRFRVEEDLKAGYSIILPEKPILIGQSPRFGWWRVGPTSGETLGIMDSGFHQADEYTELTEQDIKVLSYWRSGRFPCPECTPKWMLDWGFGFFHDWYGLPIEQARTIYIALLKAFML